MFYITFKYLNAIMKKFKISKLKKSKYLVLLGHLGCYIEHPYYFLILGVPDLWIFIFSWSRSALFRGWVWGALRSKRFIAMKIASYINDGSTLCDFCQNWYQISPLKFCVKWPENCNECEAWVCTLCNSGYYIEKDGTCAKCNNNCQQCSDMINYNFQEIRKLAFIE